MKIPTQIMSTLLGRETGANPSNRKARGLRLVLAVCQIFAALGTTAVITLKPTQLESFLGQPEVASAHNLTMQISFLALDPTMSALLEQRALANQQMVQVGDVITVVIAAEAFIGTVDGMGGFMDFYPLTGTTILNADYVKPVAGGYQTIPLKKAPGPGTVIGTSDPTGQLKNLNLGPNINGVSSSPANAGGANLGTIYGFYGDTGIFYIYRYAHRVRLVGIG